MNNPYGAYVVSWDFSHGKDVGVLIVGKQVNGKVDVINAYQGQEAYDIYETLSTRKSAKIDPIINAAKEDSANE